MPLLPKKPQIWLTGSHPLDPAALFGPFFVSLMATRCQVKGRVAIFSSDIIPGFLTVELGAR